MFAGPAVVAVGAYASLPGWLGWVFVVVGVVLFLVGLLGINATVTSSAE